MGVKNWMKKRRYAKLKGVAALDHGIVKGKGIPPLQKWEQKGELKYWGPMSDKVAYRFYMSLPRVVHNPRLGSVAEFRKWNASRKHILETAEAEFRKKDDVSPDGDLSQAERNRLGEFTRQKMNYLNEHLGSRI